MSEDQPMFPMPERWFTVGDKVTVQTIWGDEPGVVTKVSLGHLVIVALERGMVLHISPTRLAARDA